MSATHTPAVPSAATDTGALVRTARRTGLLYLGLAVTGLIGFMVIRNQLFVADDPRATLANLTGHELLARAGVVAELGVVLTQALVAVWFFRLFRSVDALAAASITMFGLVNAAAILGSAAALGTALQVAVGGAPAVAGDPAAAVQLCYLLSGQLWQVGGLFFGLWLIPMGRLARQSGWMPGLLGRLLVVGGVGYVLATVGHYLVPGAGATTELLTIPATAGELWMIGYLLVRGVRRPVVRG